MYFILIIDWFSFPVFLTAYTHSLPDNKMQDELTLYVLT